MRVTSILFAITLVFAPGLTLAQGVLDHLKGFGHAWLLAMKKCVNVCWFGLPSPTCMPAF